MPRILLIILIVVLIASLPTWPYSSGWGYYPSGGLGLIVLILVILLLTGRLFLAYGREPFIDYFRDFFAEYPQARVHVKRIIAEGDYVVVHSHFVREPADRGTAIVDIFRLENAQLAEHWDVIQRSSGDGAEQEFDVLGASNGGVAA
jgi:hypothetical protein